MMAAPARPLNVFYAYADKDQVWQEHLSTHLANMRQQELIDEWHEEKISAGTDREQAIKQHLAEADLILLLLSPDFLASPFYSSSMLAAALERHQRGKVCIIPILLRPVDMKGSRLSELEALPKDKVPISL
ncbi:MAG: toll/interleukin-1 receptor domain-containing protein [Ktedonobacteraceae bacterium]|nr:toll/interleukin-1 receptor domain-containing protein [Ktedonobacteraceae bacterium]